MSYSFASRTRSLAVLPRPCLDLSTVFNAQLPRRSKSSWSRFNPFASRGGRTGEDVQEQKKSDSRNLLKSMLTSPGSGPSMFEDEVKESAHADKTRAREARTSLPEHQAKLALDPDPQNRQRWERKMVIRMIQRNGRESRRQVIARTERQSTRKSPFLNTSVKKLVKVAHQIAGKTVDDALLQMKYSKKKAARSVLYQLQRAKDEAVAVHGMGLGSQRGKPLLDVPRTIKTKDGAHLQIRDPTSLYVAEAWVMRGPWRGSRLHFRGRGRTAIKWSPSAGVALVLKEEKTRIREYDEREAKQRRQGPWLHHKDRPVTAQRQYYTW